jgi:hypothetical protein
MLRNNYIDNLIYIYKVSRSCCKVEGNLCAEKFAELSRNLEKTINRLFYNYINYAYIFLKEDETGLIEEIEKISIEKIAQLCGNEYI